MYTYKLTKIIFNNNQEIKPGNLTVIIGPNNAGKSRALKDIIQKTTKSQPLPSIVINDIEWAAPQSVQELFDAYELNPYQDENGHWMLRTLVPDLTRERISNAFFWGDSEELSRHLANKTLFAENFGMALITFLTTEYRLQMVKEAPSSEHGKTGNQPVTNPLQCR